MNAPLGRLPRGHDGTWQSLVYAFFLCLALAALWNYYDTHLDKLAEAKPAEELLPPRRLVQPLEEKDFVVESRRPSEGTTDEATRSLFSFTDGR